ncbi:MAG: glycosyltransferase family A protein [Candidatus Saccharimonadales bacterium]
MIKPLTLTIVIPAYNEENHLSACLNSIKTQTVMPDEVIVVDNNSTDKTAKIASSYPFVRIINASQQGIVFARDRGFNSCTSTLIGRIDADCVLPNDWVAYARDFYSQPRHADVALTGGCYIYNVRLPRFAGWVQGQIAFRFNRLIMGHYILFGSNMVLPKQVWQKVKPTVCHDNDIHEDLDLAIHVDRLGLAITYHEGLKVGIKMRRIFTNRRALWGNLLLWPNTLKRHQKPTWVFGWIGAAMLYCSFPIVLSAEYLARLFGREPK